MTKGELRKLRKEAAAAGRPWQVVQEGAGFQQVRERAPAEERKHERAMERWARRYADLNGAPEGAGDA